MGLLQTYSPANDLTVLRDRIVGILLGNVVMTLVFSSLWPESAITRLRGALADALRGTAALLRLPQNAETNRQHTVEALARADNFKALSQFEMEMLPRQTHLPDLDASSDWPLRFRRRQRAARARRNGSDSCLPAIVRSSGSPRKQRPRGSYPHLEF